MIIRLLGLFMTNIIFACCAYANSVNLTFRECNNSIAIESQIVEAIPSSSAFPNNNFQSADLIFQFRIEEDGRLHFFRERSNMSHPYSRESVKLLKKNILSINTEWSCIEAVVKFDFKK